MAIDPTAIAGLVMGGGVLGKMIFDHYSEKRKIKQMGLDENPTRCEKHQRAINEIRDDIRIIKEKLDLV